MYIIVGLGNPCKEYEHTRHNAGFDTIDLLSDKYNIPVTTKKFQALIGDGIINNKRVMLVKPQTFMNLSGNAIHEILNFYHLSNEDDYIFNLVHAYKHYEISGTGMRYLIDLFIKI